MLVFVLLFGRHLHFVYIFSKVLRFACAPGFYEFLHSVNTCISKKVINMSLRRYQLG